MLEVTIINPLSYQWGT